MISVSPNPILVSLGPIDIRYYGLVYAVSFLFTYWYLAYLAKHKKISLTVSQVESFLIYTILGTVIGGRVGEYIFFQLPVLLSNPLQLFKIWEGGMAFHGAIIGIIISTTLFCRKHKVNFYMLSDNLVLPGAFALFLGRIANFINAELVGRVMKNTWYCVNWFGERNAQGELVCRHPSQLYEAAKNLFMFFILYFMQYEGTGKHKNKHYKPGYLTWLFVLMYGILRTVVNIWREDVLTVFGVLSTGQALSSLMAITALIILYLQYWRKK